MPLVAYIVDLYDVYKFETYINGFLDLEYILILTPNMAF